MKRPGPVLQMQDVLLACGELNERERVAVQWVLDRANEEIGKRGELIQRLVDALEWVASYDNGCPLPTWEEGYNKAWSIANEARKDANAAGFKPSDE